MTSLRALACFLLSGILTFTLACAQTVGPEAVLPQSGPPQPPPTDSRRRRRSSSPARLRQGLRRVLVRAVTGRRREWTGADARSTTRWSFGSDDASLAQTIRDGRPPTPMQCVQGGAERTGNPRAGDLHPRGTRQGPRHARHREAARPIDVHEVKSDLETFTLEVVAEGLDNLQESPGCPMRMLADRAHRPNPAHRARMAPCRADRGRAACREEADGGLMDIAIHPKFRDGRQQLDLPSVQRTGVIAESSSTRIIRARLEKVPEHPERLGHLERPDCHRASGWSIIRRCSRRRRTFFDRQHPLRRALHLRQGRPPVLLDRRSRPRIADGGSGQPPRQAASRPR